MKNWVAVICPVFYNFTSSMSSSDADLFTFMRHSKENLAAMDEETKQ